MNEHELKGNNSILLVMQHRDLSDLISEILAAYPLTLTHSEISGLEISFSLQPALVILDTAMPNALKMITALRGHLKLKAIPVLALTSGAADAIDTQIRALADEYLDKPFIASELQSCVERLLPHRKRGLFR